MRISIALCLPGDAETVSLVRTIAVQSLDQLGVASDCLDDIRLALGEACANVIAHADTTDDYEVRLDVDGDQCAIRVIDSGHGFDITTLTDAMPDPASPSGRGLALCALSSTASSSPPNPKPGPSSTSPPPSTSPLAGPSTSSVPTVEPRGGRRRPATAPAPSASTKRRNAETVRRMYRTAGVPFENVWAASPLHRQAAAGEGSD